MEKIIIEPKEVRGLGDIVSPKTSSDFLGWNNALTSSTDSDYGTVYTGSYLAGSVLTVSSGRWRTVAGDSFPVGITLKTRSNSAISSASVKCVVNNDTVLTATTASDGTATFSIPKTSGVCVYDLWFTYAGTSSVAGCFRGFRVLLGDNDFDLDLIGESEIIQSGDRDVLLATVSAENCNGEVVGVPGETVYFFEEWTPNVRLSGEASIIQSSDTDVLTAQLIDNEDGSIVKESGHTVYFYKDLGYDLYLTYVDDPISSVFTGSFQLNDKDGNPLAGEEISVYVNVDVVETLTTGEQGKASFMYPKSTVSGKNFYGKYKELESDKIVVS